MNLNSDPGPTSGGLRLRELIGMAHPGEASATGNAKAAPAAGEPGVSTAPAGGGAVSISPDASVSERQYVQLLRDLAELRDAGILSEQEFEAKKADVLKRL